MASTHILKKVGRPGGGGGGGRVTGQSRTDGGGGLKSWISPDVLYGCPLRLLIGVKLN